MISGYVAMKNMFLGGGHLGFSNIVMTVNVTAKCAADFESLSVKKHRICFYNCNSVTLVG